MAGSSSRSSAMPVSMTLFGLGLLAIVLVFGFYAAGCENLPVWLNLATLLAPLGLVIGVVAVILNARKN